MFFDLMNDINISKLHFRNFAVWGIAALVLVVACDLRANTAIQSNDQGSYNLVITDNVGSELQLEVQHIPLAQVLENIAKKMHMPIHYSVLPEGLVTATCVGTTMKQIIECLLDKKADLIVRYPNNRSQLDGRGQIAEAWILGSRLDGITAKNCSAPANYASFDLLQTKQNDENAARRSDELLKMAQSTNSEERADAIGALLADGREGDPDVKATLEQALTDQDANVRAQAISTLSHREGNIADEIQQALQDNAPEVRLMAVDSITNDAALLQQAINDSDETVRNLAITKLEELGLANNNVK
jgi:hypothetical protein